MAGHSLTNRSHAAKRKIGARCVALFVVNVIALRILVPYGDDPDYMYRFSQLAATENQPIWSPYRLFHDDLNDLLASAPPVRPVDSSPLGLWAHLDPTQDAESPQRIISRLLITLVIVAPLLVSLTFMREDEGTSSSQLKHSLRSGIGNLRGATALAVCLPSTAYYASTLSHEQLVLVLSLGISLIWNVLPIVVIFLGLILSLDAGNGLVIAAFLIVAKLALFMRMHRRKKMLWLTTAMLVLSALIFGYAWISILEAIPFVREESTAILSSMQGNQLVNKYPILLRPVITYMTFVFSTPSNIKAPIAYLMAAAGLGLTCWRASVNRRRVERIDAKKDSEVISEENALILIGVTEILVLVLSLPTYANAKYFVFLAPVFLLAPLRIFGAERLFGFCLLLSLLVHVQLALYWVT